MAGFESILSMTRNVNTNTLLNESFSQALQFAPQASPLILQAIYRGIYCQCWPNRRSELSGYRRGIASPTMQEYISTIFQVSTDLGIARANIANICVRCQGKASSASVCDGHGH